MLLCICILVYIDRTAIERKKYIYIQLHYYFAEEKPENSKRKLPLLPRSICNKIDMQLISFRVSHYGSNSNCCGV